MTVPVLSILVPTLTGREALFAKLMQSLEDQIAACQAQEVVEVLTDIDDGLMTIGEKRNRLMDKATGTFIASIDDDDDIHPRYVELILSAIDQNPGLQVLGLKGEMVFADGTRQAFIYSNEYSEYWTIDGIMRRPPHHLNPMLRSIAMQFRYEHVRAHEDADVALRMARAGVLQRQVMVHPVLYIYQTRRNRRWHTLLEKTEVWRHPLGIKLVNLVVLRRWFNRRLGR